MNYTENAGKAIDYLSKQGAFLTVKDNDGKVNTMTIAWGNIGFEWGKPMFTVMVRKSRYTYDLIENAKDFTVSIPLDDDMKKALGFCGSKSGREYDKFKECNLKIKKGEKVCSPAIDDCGLVYECKIVYKQQMDPKFLDEKIKDTSYSNENYHTVYYGEILACYETK